MQSVRSRLLLSTKRFLHKHLTSNLNTKTNVKTNKELFSPLPPSLYNDVSVYQLEREKIFSRNWIYAGRLDGLKNLGDFLSITIAGHPIFIYRSPLTKELTGFHNVCSHRAGPIVPNNYKSHGVPLYGNQSLLRCQYHAWLFDSRDGSLKATPNFGFSFNSDEKKCLGLRKIHVETFADQFIFVRFNDFDESTSINRLLSDLLKDILKFPLHEYRYFQSQSHIINCNWKTYVENYQEGYHIPSIHPLLHKTVQSKDYKVTNEKDIYSIHYVPARDSTCDQGNYLWSFIYPNLAINLYEKGYSVENILPLGVDRTILSYEFFMRSTKDQSQTKCRLEEAEQAIRRTLEITEEDKAICEQVQINLNAGIYRPGYLSPTMENGVALFQNKIRQELKGTKLQL